MPYSDALLAYADVAEALDKALLTPSGVRIDFDHLKGDALRRFCNNYVLRCNKFRRVMRKEAAKGSDEPYASTDYDRLKISNEGTHVKIIFWKSLRMRVSELDIPQTPDV